MKKLNAQEVEQILDSPISAVVRIANKMQYDNPTNTTLINEARVKAHGIEIDRGPMITMQARYSILERNKIPCQLLELVEKDVYVIREERIC
jgi:hypothetical protein